MIGPLIALFAAIAAAGAVLLVLLSRRMPEEGLVSWLRESFATTREDKAGAGDSGAGRVTAASSSVESADGAIHVSDLMGLGEDGPAYHRPVDLRAVVRGRQR
ncbi:hypothetical protein [Ruania halotolerans]|uniref:hypothetical protein n=1 Tax=Ruania halotolerans TaxID=2897773 RepID=UPI001E41E73E|nr:hypothetical protein [Ruania halotolerans]UFU05222.1 hypothetical protein LQF10_12190 [Ruania halotolerans]